MFTLFDAFPPEIKFAVMEQCDTNDLISLSLTNKETRSLAEPLLPEDMSLAPCRESSVCNVPGEHEAHSAHMTPLWCQLSSWFPNTMRYCFKCRKYVRNRPGHFARYHVERRTRRIPRRIGSFRRHNRVSDSAVAARRRQLRRLRGGM